MISINFVNLIPQDFINKFKYGIINSHLGDLPRYKGNACPNWAILNSEKSINLTLHKINSELDSGPIVLKDKFFLKEDTYISDVYEWSNNRTTKLFEEAVKKIINGDKFDIQKGKSHRTFPRKPSDAKLNFNKNIDWNYKLIRASSRPLPGAFAFLNESDKKVTIFKAEPFDIDYDFSAVSGQIMEKMDNEFSFLVAIKNKVLKITEYSINGLDTKNSYKVICSSMRNRLT